MTIDQAWQDYQEAREAAGMGNHHNIEPGDKVDHFVKGRGLVVKVDGDDIYVRFPYLGAFPSIPVPASSVRLVATGEPSTIAPKATK